MFHKQTSQEILYGVGWCQQVEVSWSWSVRVTVKPNCLFLSSCSKLTIPAAKLQQCRISCALRFLHRRGQTFRSVGRDMLLLMSLILFWLLVWACLLTVRIFKGNKLKSLNFVLLLVFLTAFFFPLDHSITCNVITTEASMVLFLRKGTEIWTGWAVKW